MSNHTSCFIILLIKSFTLRSLAPSGLPRIASRISERGLGGALNALKFQRAQRGSLSELFLSEKICLVASARASLREALRGLTLRLRALKRQARAEAPSTESEQPLLCVFLVADTHIHRCIYIYIYICIYVYTYTHECVYMCIYIYIYTCIYTHLPVRW